MLHKLVAYFATNFYLTDDNYNIDTIVPQTYYSSLK